MSFINELRAARTAAVAAVHEFALKYDPRSSVWHVFFEGQQDEPFYLTYLLRRVTRENLKTYRCGNKKEVLSALESVARKYPHCDRTLFFVDKDLADIIPDTTPVSEKLFITSGYSIENYFASPDVISQAARDMFHVIGANYDLSLIDPVFKRSFARFADEARLLMAWIVAARRAGCRPNVNNVDPARIFSLDDDLNCAVRRPRSGAIEYLYASTGVAPGTVSGSLVRKAARDLANATPHGYLRGKFAVWFCLQFLNRVEAAMRTTADEVGGRFSKSTLLHARNFVEVLAPRVPEPPELTVFLNRHIPS